MITNSPSRCRVGLAIQRTSSLREADGIYRSPEVLDRLTREALLQGGLGTKSPERPLCDIISPGMKVLVKPNWVLHCNRGGSGMACMVTHPGFILAALTEVFKAEPGRVILGDAPIQSCLWDRLVTTEFQSRVRDLAATYGVDVQFVDFRRTIVPTGNLADGTQTRPRDESRYILFDLGRDSLLEPISRPVGRFRVTCYDPDKLAQTHRPGTHKYLLCREAFEADVIFSLPKLKLHCKAGLTGALKNLVGLNGSKDYLPHHRLGGSKSGGDCYPGRSMLKRFAEFLYDRANRRIGTRTFRFWNRLASAVRRVTTNETDGQLDGSWHGNDTTWRMVLDLNRILLYGRADGTMADTPLRRLYSLADGIVCGEGEGPLSPRPLPVGAVTFSENAPAADAAHASLLRLDYRRMPLVRQAFGQFRWPLTLQGERPDVRFEGRTLSVEQVAEELGVRAVPPEGWAGHVEWEG